MLILMFKGQKVLVDLNIRSALFPAYRKSNRGTKMEITFIATGRKTRVLIDDLETEDGE